jgi:selenocysteine lyase/cysteine desulfurase
MAMTGAAGVAVAGAGIANAQTSFAGLGPDDEAGWARLAALYPVSRKVIQLENGYWGSMATPVMAVHRAVLDRLNAENSVYARRAMQKDRAVARERMAVELGVQPREIGVARNAAEALSALICQFRDVGAGDQVMYSDLDYESAQGAMVSLARERRAEAVKLSAPRDLTHDGLIAFYTDAIARTPKLKLVLLTHMVHRNGLVLPVAAITAFARARGVQVIVDAAQSFAHIDFKLPDFGADFVGMNFHKWVGAPLGVAALWIRASAIPQIAPARDEPEADDSDAQSRLHLGTFDFAPLLTVPAAFDFQARITVPTKLKRLQYLRNRWVKPVRGLDGVEVLLPDDPRMHGASTSFRIKGRTSTADNIAITDALLERFNIMSVHRSGLADGACVRITPSLFSTLAEVDALAPALRTLAGEMAR